jgi:hypothetical protein
VRSPFFATASTNRTVCRDLLCYYCSSGPGICYTFPTSRRFLCFLGLGLDVALNEELSEQDEQRQDVHNVSEDHPEAGGGALRRHQVGALRHHCHKLDHLHHRQARLPPNRQGLAGDRILGAGVSDVGNNKHG